MSALAEVLRSVEPISLAEMNSAAELMSRVDRKYFVPRDTLASILESEVSDIRALEIGDVRSFRYQTVYLDSPRFDFYRAHVQRRRNRFKVRTRTYTDSGLCMLEVKSKGARGRTVKNRIPHDPETPELLTTEDRTFVSHIIDSDAMALHPVLETVYSRSTLVLGDHRVTLDTNLECSHREQTITGPEEVLVETKSPDGAGVLDHLLISRGIRPHSVSKYCMSASLLYPRLRGNDWTRLRQRYWRV